MANSEKTPRRPGKKIRCAIYTRKSTDEGLEQAFNSLDAQREACAAFVTSQKHEGWTALPAPYDDAGYSGGTMERPALQRLLVDIEAGQVDAVVVYKVDRLTRALSDFAKLVEVFDRRGVSFVSITQQFNTTTSMGRLTLNVLLSFAQFEREVIGERVRDKIAASKKKGMWMGGMPPLGYEVKDRKLVINRSEARTVVDIYRRYLALKSVRNLQGELVSLGIRSKRKVRPDGTTYGGQEIARGALYLTLAVEMLRPYERNARTHTNKQIRQIAKSIQRFGFCNPILVDDQAQILAGHGRVAAAKLLGIKEVPTVKLAHLSDVERRAYILADNRLAEKAGWDREILAIELQALVSLDFEVELTGFETAEVDLILEEADEAAGGPGGREDESPIYSAGPAVTLPGDLWELGPHHLLCADARQPAAYVQLLDNAKAEFVFTDPPYNVPIDGHVCGLGRIRHADFAMGCGEMTAAEFRSFLETVFGQLAANTIDGSIHQTCMDWRHMPEMLAAGHAVYGELKNLCVWNKSNAGMGTFYRSKHELVFVWKSGTAPHVNTFELGQFGRSRSNVWDYPGVNSLKPGRLDELAKHPTVKPVALVADAIKDCSRRSGLVLDPFAGSGTVLIAAERTGRRARALEIDPRYVDVGVRRWEGYTGKAAVLAGTASTFEEIGEQRASGHVAVLTGSGGCDVKPGK